MSLLILPLGNDPNIFVCFDPLSKHRPMSDSPWLEGLLCSWAAAEPGQVARAFVRLRLQNVQGEAQDPFFTHLQTFYM